MVFETLVYLPFKLLMWQLAREYFIELSCLASFKLNNTLFEEQGYNCAPQVSSRNSVSTDRLHGLSYWTRHMHCRHSCSAWCYSQSCVSFIISLGSFMLTDNFS